MARGGLEAKRNPHGPSAWPVSGLALGGLQLGAALSRPAHTCNLNFVLTGEVILINEARQRGREDGSARHRRRARKPERPPGRVAGRAGSIPTGCRARDVLPANRGDEAQLTERTETGPAGRGRPNGTAGAGSARRRSETGWDSGDGPLGPRHAGEGEACGAVDGGRWTRSAPRARRRPRRDPRLSRRCPFSSWTVLWLKPWTT